MIYGIFFINILALVIFFIITIKNSAHNTNYTTTLLRLEETFLRIAKQQDLVEQQKQETVLKQFHSIQQSLIEKLSSFQINQNQYIADLKENLQQALSSYRMQFDEKQFNTLKILQDTLQKGNQDNRLQLKETLDHYTNELSKKVEKLTQTTETKLSEINQQVEKRLFQGFEKTNETFSDIIKRLALIDAAQKKITELSNNVMNLQDILNDKRSRGAFGEIQLAALIRNMIPEHHFSFQHLLSNNKRPDCMLFLPEPTGNIAIDAKFPLENFRLAMSNTISEHEKQQAEKSFKIDIRKHIQDIADKYIIAGETSDGAMMFIPAEAIFAEIHTHHVDLVELAQKSKVWMVSPTTLMAVLTTARAVLKDAATRKQMNEIQKHLKTLAEDFERFQYRMDSLAKRIAQAHADVDQVHISSKKISQRFVQIEQVDLKELTIS